MSERPLVHYEPNPALAWFYRRFFAHIEIDEAWANEVRKAASNGTVVYVLRNLSVVDFLALDHLTKRLGLPEVRFANDLGLWILEPMGRGWLNALKRRTPRDDADDLRRAVLARAPAALFLKRPGHLLETKTRGKIEGDLFLQTLFDVQKKTDVPILLVPQVFVWTKHQDTAKLNLIDGILGPREWPGNLRSAAQFLANYRHVILRAGEPIDLREFLKGAGDQEEIALVRTLTHTILRRLERERRVVLGPTRKPADRLRAEVLRSQKLKKVIADLAGDGRSERYVLTARAYQMLKEMEAGLELDVIRALDAAFRQVTSRMYRAIEIDKDGVERLRNIAKEGTLVLLPSHKSHVDYILMTHVCYAEHLPVPLVAAGDNLNFFPMGRLLRMAGAFYIRRSFRGDRLYGAVVDAYMRKLIKDGWALEFFLEGGRSRSGKLLPPKLGLLSIVVDAALSMPEHRVFFCPVSIGYERFVEEDSFVRELSGGEKKKENVSGLVGALEAMLKRYGRVNVDFGRTFTLSDISRELFGDGEAIPGELPPAKRRALVTRLAYRAMHEIHSSTAVTGGALVATALLSHPGRGLPHGDLLRLCEHLATILFRHGARFAPSLAGRRDPGGQIRSHALRDALDLFVRAGHVEAHRPGTPIGSKKAQGHHEDAVYSVTPVGRLSLDLAKNTLVTFFVPRALLSTALVSLKSVRTVDALSDRVQALSRLFKFEFLFRADAPFATIFDDVFQAMTADGELVVTDGIVSVPPNAEASVLLYTRILRNFVEGYRVMARTLPLLLKGAVSQKELCNKAIVIGERMFLAGEIECREAATKPLLENAIAAFIDQGYIERTGGDVGGQDKDRVTLFDTYATPDAVRTVEAKIVSYLAPPSGRIDSTKSEDAS